jgi:hypothetical protein
VKRQREIELKFEWVDSLSFETHQWVLTLSLWWFLFHWTKWNYVSIHWFEKEDREWGYQEIWYDGPWYSFGLWFFCVAWELD